MGEGIKNRRGTTGSLQRKLRYLISLVNAVVWMNVSLEGLIPKMAILGDDGIFMKWGLVGSH
jgi:hypothetical protein